MHFNHLTVTFTVTVTCCVISLYSMLWCNNKFWFNLTCPADVCCIPDIWVSDGRLMRLSSLSITPPPRTPRNPPGLSNGHHHSVISNGITHRPEDLHHHQISPHIQSPPESCYSDMNDVQQQDIDIKLERTTPSSSPLNMIPPHNMSAILEPVQNMPLDLVRSCISTWISLNFTLFLFIFY